MARQIVCGSTGLLRRRRLRHPMRVRFGREVCGNLEAASEREWLVTDGLGAIAMGPPGGLGTGREPGTPGGAARPPARRMLGLAGPDAILTLGELRARTGAH